MKKQISFPVLATVSEQVYITNIYFKKKNLHSESSLEMLQSAFLSGITAKWHSPSSGSRFALYPPLLSNFLFIFPPLTGCLHISSQLPTTSYSATTDLNADLASSVPLRQEREIPYPRLPPTMLQGRILPVSSVFRLPEYTLLFLPDSYTFSFQLISAQTGKHCSWLKERLSLGTKRVHSNLVQRWFLLGLDFYFIVTI